jgi:putative lumazine-binding protein
MNASSEENGIRETINYHVDGMRTGNVEILKKGFHQLAILCGYLGDEMIAAPIEGLYDWVNSNPAPAQTGEGFDCSTLSIEITGRVAAVTMRETSHEGDVIDYFHLLKDKDRWWVVSKLWDAE